MRAFTHRIVFFSFASLVATGCATLPYQGVEWVTLQHKENRCSLSSTPVTFSTLAGHDTFTLGINSENLIYISILNKPAVTLRMAATYVQVDSNPPLSPNDISNKNQLITFNAEQSRALIKQLTEGQYVHVKLGITNLNTNTPYKLRLNGFNERLLKVRLCNVVTSNYENSEIRSAAQKRL